MNGQMRAGVIALLMGLLLILGGPAQAAMTRCEVYPCESESGLCGACPTDPPIVVETPCVRWTIVGTSWGAHTEITDEDLGCG